MVVGCNESLGQGTNFMGGMGRTVGSFPALNIFTVLGNFEVKYSTFLRKLIASGEYRLDNVVY